jgi:CheY-like chemotaxis protein
MTMKILIVDDDDVLRSELAEYLIREGHDVQSAESGSAALSMVKKKDYKLIFTDLKMPGMNGMDVLREVKKLRPNIHMVMITGYGTIDSAVEAMKIGADDYIRKPFEMGQLKSIIDNVMKGMEFERQLERIGIMKEEGKKDPFEMFKSAAQGRNGLCISSQDPKTLKKKYDLGNISWIWLNSKEECDFCIPPKNIYDLKLAIRSFFKENPQSVILLEGTEVLLEHHSWDIVQKFIKDLLNDLTESSRLIISIKPGQVMEKGIMDLNRMISNPYIQLISEILSSPIRRHILGYMSIQRSSSFSEILRETKIKDAPKLSFHLRKLVNDKMLSKDENKGYTLTERGKEVAEYLSALEKNATSNMQNNVSLILSPDEY